MRYIPVSAVDGAIELNRIFAFAHSAANALVAFKLTDLQLGEIHLKPQLWLHNTMRRMVEDGGHRCWKC